MVGSVVPPWHGGNYQSRIFWLHAMALRQQASGVVEVTFEADGPKSFDDVVVRYDPPRAGSGPLPVPADYYQVKWHVHSAGRFGYADLTEPDFIGAARFSLLERLRDAKSQAPVGSRFALVTPYRIIDGDPLGLLFSHTDRSLLTEKLFDDTTDASRMGAIRKMWREHLDLADDQALRDVVEGLRIFEGYQSLEELRDELNLRATAVGLRAYPASTSDFRYDELARQLRSRGLNRLDRSAFEAMCRAEDVVVAEACPADRFLKIAIRTFEGATADVSGVRAEDTLLLTGAFRERYLRDDIDWQRDLRPQVEEFLRAAARRSGALRLFLDAHASIAFLAGSVLHLKSGAEVELMQKGHLGGTRAWRADDGLDGPPLGTAAAANGPGRDIAVGISLARDVEADMLRYVSANLPNVGSSLLFSPAGGSGGMSVRGGAHAAACAEQIARELRKARGADPDRVAHIFAACPNALLFFLGQHYQAVAPCVFYEFDFDRKGNKTYQPSVLME